MYDQSDPRSTLSAGGSTATDFAAAEYLRFYATEPREKSESMKVWYGRGQNFVVAYAEVLDGAKYVRPKQPDEYVVLIPDAATSIEVTWAGSTSKIAGNSIVFIPAGDSVIRATAPGRLVMMFTAASEDLCEKSANAKAYRSAHPNIPPFAPWPDPPDGFMVRQYSLDVPDQPGRFGRIWRCTTFMVNVLPAQHGPRDVTKLSPHFHDSFEQGSLALEGSFTHHVRWPWTSNLNNWRADDHEYCGAASLAVIPPPAIHTSRGMSEGINQLVDIFSPPRIDFSQKDGWVLNESDYPMTVVP
ncbi:hypothetical protein OKW41_002724 [Paraburkholderia sp. UCT70]|uniref:hypothetical protein n=1 Tax=Paraburkholderia sp. UCT70 TaxID=2991068 RepID=UPI003D1D9D7A